MTNERLLCRSFSQGEELFLTSKRIIVLKTGLIKKALAFGERHGGAVDSAFFATLRAKREPAEGTTSIALKEESFNSTVENLLNAGKVKLLLPFADISAIWLEKKYQGGILYISCPKIKKDKLKLLFSDDGWFLPLWKTLQSIAPDKLLFPSEDRRTAFVAELSKLKNMLIDDFCDYLNRIGFRAEVVDALAHKGLIKLSGAHIDYIEKDETLGQPIISFIVECVSNVPSGTRLKVGKNGRRVREIRWEGKSNAFVSALNQDEDLQNQITTEIEKGSFRWLTLVWSQDTRVVVGMKTIVDVKGKPSVSIRNCIANLPSDQYFHAMDRIACYMRNVGN